MANLETDVPQEIEHLLHHLLDVWGNFLPAVGVKKHHIDVAARIEFAAAVAAQRQERERGRGSTCFESGKRIGGGKDMAQQHIHDFRAARANFSTTTARLMPEPQSMFFDAKKLLVERKDFGRTRASGRSELALACARTCSRCRDIG